MLIKQKKKFALIQTNRATYHQSLNKSTSTLHNRKKGENYQTTIQLSNLSQSHSTHELDSPKKKRKGVWNFGCTEEIPRGKSRPIDHHLKAVRQSL